MGVAHSHTEFIHNFTITLPPHMGGRRDQNLYNTIVASLTATPGNIALCNSWYQVTMVGTGADRDPVTQLERGSISLNVLSRVRALHKLTFAANAIVKGD